MKLELKHLAPYLPYGLKFELLDYKCDYVGEKYGICNGYYFIGDGVYYTFKDRDTAGKNSNNCKPILRPLSDLNPKGEDIFKDNTEEMEFLKQNNLHLSNSMVIELIKKKGLLYRDFEYLLKRHFDVFGLIEKGLAIDKNTINGNS